MWTRKDAECRKRGQLESEEDEEVGGVWNVGNVVELEEEEESTCRPGCRSKYWNMKINVMSHAKFVKIDVLGSAKIRGDSNDGFVQSSKRKTCKVGRRQVGRRMRIGATRMSF